MEVLLVRKSGNAKLGPIPATFSTAKWCPSSCGLKKHGCYAEGGNTNLHWQDVTQGRKGVAWETFIDEIEQLPANTLWRHNVAGDLPGRRNRLDVDGLLQLAFANRGKRGFTYTHYSPLVGDNGWAIKRANEMGFRVNVSADNLRQADAYMAAGVAPVVTVLPVGQTENVKTPAGHTVVVCPATTREGVTCKSCQLCQRERTTIVGFPAHGFARRRAERVFYMKAVA